MVTYIADIVDIVNTADVRRGYGAKRSWRLQVMTVVETGWRTGPVGESRGTDAGRHQVEFRNPRKWNRGKITLKLIEGMFSRRRVAHLS